jgi:hypothetical protein
MIVITQLHKLASLLSNCSSKEWWFALVLSFAAICGSGCGETGPIIAPVTGRVRYNGEAVEGAVVYFSAEKSPLVAAGRTDSSGGFSLTTKIENDGAVVGMNVVTVFKPGPPMTDDDIDAAASEDLGQIADLAERQKAATEIKRNAMKRASIVGKNNMKRAQLPLKYADKKTSGLSATVEQGKANEFTFDLDGPAPKR